MYCNACGAKIKEEQKFCHKCGSDLSDVGIRSEEPKVNDLLNDIGDGAQSLSHNVKNAYKDIPNDKKPIAIGVVAVIALIIVMGIFGGIYKTVAFTPDKGEDIIEHFIENVFRDNADILGEYVTSDKYESIKNTLERSGTAYKAGIDIINRMNAIVEADVEAIDGSFKVKGGKATGKFNIKTELEFNSEEDEDIFKTLLGSFGAGQVNSVAVEFEKEDGKWKISNPEKLI